MAFHEMQSGALSVFVQPERTGNKGEGGSSPSLPLPEPLPGDGLVIPRAAVEECSQSLDIPSAELQGCCQSLDIPSTELQGCYWSLVIPELQECCQFGYCRSRTPGMLLGFGYSKCRA